MVFWGIILVSMYFFNDFFFNTCFILSFPIEFLIDFLIYLFIIGIYGAFLNRNNYFNLLLGVELQLLCLGVLYTIVSLYRGDNYGFIITLLLQTLAACEAAVGLALLSRLFLSNYISLSEIYYRRKVKQVIIYKRN